MACLEIHAPAALYSGKKGMLAYLWDERMGELQSQPGKGAEEKNYFIYWKSNPGRPNHNTAIMKTKFLGFCIVYISRLLILHICTNCLNEHDFLRNLR